MSVLRSSAPSPFGRKVKIAAKVLGLDGDIAVETADTTNPDDPLRRQNPLGKIPALILDDGMALFDSRVIVEYLDDLAGGGKIIPEGASKYQALTLQALSDGMMDASILQVYEARFRTEDKQDENWISYQAEKVTRALKALEAHTPPRVGAGGIPNVGQISLACALGYLDLRFNGAWRKDHPKLVSWLDDFSNVTPAFAATKAPS